MTVEEVYVEEYVADVGYNAARDVWRVCYPNGEVDVISTEDMEKVDGRFINDDFSELHEVKKRFRCRVCSSEPFYDENSEEWYCPVCT